MFITPLYVDDKNLFACFPFFCVYHNETRNPMKPVNISVMMNPRSETTKIFSPGTINKVVNKSTATASRVPSPAKLIGMNPATLATGNSNRNK